jgi:tripartite-type tricarboxylate transporter receptor subunit TctC
MMKRFKSLKTPFLWCLLAIHAFGFSTTAAAEDVAAFYAGKELRVLSPFSINGTYGQLVRVIATYLPKYLPGHPNGVPQYMPGAGGLRGTNYMATGAPRDGTVISIMYDSMPATQVTEPKEVRFDAREFNLLGSINKGDFGLVSVLKTVGAKDIEEAKKKELWFGATGTASAQYYVLKAMNALLATKFKIIPGYPSVADQYLAMEKGELHGIFTNYTIVLLARPEWFRDNKLDFLGQLGLERDSRFSNVPLLQELTTDQRAKQIFEFFALSRVTGKAFFTPPNVPPDRLAALRTAFAATLRDPEVRDAISKLQQELDPRDWQTAQSVVRRTVNTPADVIAQVQDLAKTGK